MITENFDKPTHSTHKHLRAEQQTEMRRSPVPVHVVIALCLKQGLIPLHDVQLRAEHNKLWRISPVFVHIPDSCFDQEMMIQRYEKPMRVLYERLRAEPRTVMKRSPIHNLGLFAVRDIDAYDMVIEYVGEVLREQV